MTTTGRGLQSQRDDTFASVEFDVRSRPFTYILGAGFLGLVAGLLFGSLGTPLWKGGNATVAVGLLGSLTLIGVGFTAYPLRFRVVVKDGRIWTRSMFGKATWLLEESSLIRISTRAGSPGVLTIVGPEGLAHAKAKLHRELVAPKRLAGIVTRMRRALAADSSWLKREVTLPGPGLVQTVEWYPRGTSVPPRDYRHADNLFT